jgi:hypothetical protein
MFEKLRWPQFLGQTVLTKRDQYYLPFDKTFVQQMIGPENSENSI